MLDKTMAARKIDMADMPAQLAEHPADAAGSRAGSSIPAMPSTSNCRRCRVVPSPRSRREHSHPMRRPASPSAIRPHRWTAPFPRPPL